jgi:hypothetical protein
MAKLLRIVKQKLSMWENIGGIAGFHAAVNELDKAIITQLLGEKIPGNYRESTSVWGSLAATSKLKGDNSLQNRKWLYTVWRNDRREVCTLFKTTQTIDNLPQLNGMKGNNDSNDAARNNNKVDNLVFL